MTDLMATDFRPVRSDHTPDKSVFVVNFCFRRSSESQKSLYREINLSKIKSDGSWNCELHPFPGVGVSRPLTLMLQARI